MADGPAARRNPDIDPYRTVGADGIVIGWVRCQGCNYRLRGLAAAAHCPECGAAISESTRVTTLRRLTSVQIRKMRTGVTAFAITIIVTLLGAAALPAAPWLGVLMLPVAVLSTVIAVIAVAEMQVDALPAVASAASGFVGFLAAIPLAAPILGAMSVGILLSVWGTSTKGAPETQVLHLLGAIAGGAIGGLVPAIILQPLSEFSRLLDAVFDDCEDRVPPTHTRTVRTFVRAAQISFLIAAVVLALGGGAAKAARWAAVVALPGVIAIGLASVWLLMVIGTVRQVLRDAWTEAQERERFIGGSNAPAR